MQETTTCKIDSTAVKKEKISSIVAIVPDTLFPKRGSSPTAGVKKKKMKGFTCHTDHDLDKLDYLQITI